MGLIQTASGNSVLRGLNYYEENKVVSWTKTGIHCYDGVVLGSEGQKLLVHVDKEHPKRSLCNCAFATGRRVVCKHMIALYFAAEPEAAKEFKELIES